MYVRIRMNQKAVGGHLSAPRVPQAQSGWETSYLSTGLLVLLVAPVARASKTLAASLAASLDANRAAPRA